MGNYVIICHGGAEPDAGPVQVPEGSELQFWVNEGQPAYVGPAKDILAELLRNPTDVGDLQRFIARTWTNPQVRWDETHGRAGDWVTALGLHGDDDVDCVGVADLTTRTFTRWNRAHETTLKRVLADYPGNLHLICCRG